MFKLHAGFFLRAIDGEARTDREVEKQIETVAMSSTHIFSHFANYHFSVWIRLHVEGVRTPGKLQKK